MALQSERTTLSISLEHGEDALIIKDDGKPLLGGRSKTARMA